MRKPPSVTPDTSPHRQMSYLSADMRAQLKRKVCDGALKSGRHGMLLKGLMPIIAGGPTVTDRARQQHATATDQPTAGGQPEHVNKRSRRSRGGNSEEKSVSTIARGIRVEGEVSGTGVIHIEGTVVGTIRAEHRVLVAEGGTVEGDIHAQEAILSGEIAGSIVANKRVEATASAVIHGDITTPNLAVHEGANVCGSVHMVKKTGTAEAS